MFEGIKPLQKKDLGSNSWWKAKCSGIQWAKPF